MKKLVLLIFSILMFCGCQKSSEEPNNTTVKDQLDRIISRCVKGNPDFVVVSGNQRYKISIYSFEYILSSEDGSLVYKARSNGILELIGRRQDDSQLSYYKATTEDEAEFKVIISHAYIQCFGTR